MLNEGKLVTFGVKNVHFLNEIIQAQYYLIDYEYSQIKAEISCPVVSFSTDKSILNFVLKVPFVEEKKEEMMD